MMHRNDFLLVNFIGLVIYTYIYIITFHGSNEQHNGDESFHRTENNIAPNVTTERNGITIIIEMLA